MHEASLWLQSESASILLEHGASVESSDLRGDTPLHVAGDQRYILSNNPDSVIVITRNLLRFHASINAQNTLGETPLHNVHVSLEKWRVLIEHGADLGKTDGKGNTPLCIGLREGFIGHVRLLVESNLENDILSAITEVLDKDGNSLLHHAVKDMAFFRIAIRFVQYCLEEMDEEFLFLTQNRDGNTALHVACENDTDSYVRLLLLMDQGNQNNDDYSQSYSCVGWPKKRQRDLAITCFTMKNALGKTAFQVAIEKSNVRAVVAALECIRTLQSLEITGFQLICVDSLFEELCTYRDMEGNSILHQCVRVGAVGCLRKLVEFGMDVNSSNTIFFEKQSDYKEDPFSELGRGTPLHIGKFKVSSRRYYFFGCWRLLLLLLFRS